MSILRLWMFGILLTNISQVARASESPLVCRFELNSRAYELVVEYDSIEKCFSMQTTVDGKKQSYSCKKTRSGELSQKEIQEDDYNKND